MHHIDESSNAVQQSLHVEINKMMSRFLPCTARKLNDVVEGLHDELKEEWLKNHAKHLKLKEEAYASLMEFRRHAKGQGEGQEEGHEGQEEEEGHYLDYSEDY